MAAVSRVTQHVTKLKQTLTSFLKTTITQMALTSDLSAIEHLWVDYQICIMDVQPANLQQLCDVMMTIWTKMSETCLLYLVESIPRRIQAVLAKRGSDPL